MKRIILMMITAVACSLAAVGMSSPKQSLVRYDRVQTVNAKVYPHGTVQGCAWFVEQVL
jgi:hypothetical protein